MKTLYEQINTRKIVLPPELQEFFSTIYDTSKKYEFVYLGKNIAWKPLIHKTEDILILKFLDEKFWESEYAIAKQDWGFPQPIVFVPDPYKDNEVRKVSRVDRGTKFEVYAVVGTKTKHFGYKYQIEHNVESSDLPSLRGLAGKITSEISDRLTNIIGGKYKWLDELLTKTCSYVFKTKTSPYYYITIPKDFGRDLDTSREVFDYLLTTNSTIYYAKVIPTIKALRKKESELDDNAYALYRFLLLWQSIVDKNKL